MQGNYGPDEKMKTALGAYTPNVPWAEIDCAKIVDMDGAGTSAATPQIAAAAALWLAEHWDVVKNYSQPWMRIEAVRFALFAKAAQVDAKNGSRPKRSRRSARACSGPMPRLPYAAGRRTSCENCAPAEHSWALARPACSAAASVWRRPAPRRTSGGACWRWN